MSTLTSKRPLETLLDLEPLSAIALADADDIRHAKLRYGRSSVPVSELFEVSTDGEEGLTLRGDLRLAINTGAGLREGMITAESSVGAGAGARMEGGKLTIRGSAGKNACREMQNGFAVIAGTAEDGLAHSMRRGMVVVEGISEGQIGTQMRGGTILLTGGVAYPDQLARGMSRGTVILPAEAFVPGGFSQAASVDLVFLRLLFHELMKRGITLPEGWVGGIFTRFRGDAAGLCKGELFVFAGGRV